MDVSKAILTGHAVLQMQKRQVSEADVQAVLEQPDDIRFVRPGRVVAQAVIDRGI